MDSTINLNIEFCVPNREAFEIARAIFADIPTIKVSNTSITAAQYSTIISAGNSFGEMNGGIDGIINTLLSAYTPSRYIQEDVKSVINNKYIGELPVGTSILVKTNHPRYTSLIYTPTMRVAENVSTTLNAYLAFRSSLLLMMHAQIKYASVPLFCTGAGAMSIIKSCNQMKEAYTSITKKILINGDWNIYHSHHRKLLNM
jgi:O-acetyl-ADP-ribose deacetylase (regulator of RNase III)